MIDRALSHAFPVEPGDASLSTPSVFVIPASAKEGEGSRLAGAEALRAARESDPSPGAGASRDPAPEPPHGVVRRTVTRTRHVATETFEDHIAEEVPVALVYNDAPFAVMMATPADLVDFALGFTITEGIASAADVGSIAHRELLEGHELRIAIPPARAAALADRRRNLAGRSGCGLCGTESLEAAMREPTRVAPADFDPTDEALDRALAQLPHHQPINALTAATHAAAWCDARGDIVLCREDVGRHNALDKLVGAMASRRIDATRGFALVTSRASYEIVTKAAAAGIATIAAISAPTALAIACAQRAGIALVAFARAGSRTMYGSAESSWRPRHRPPSSPLLPAQTRT